MGNFRFDPFPSEITERFMKKSAARLHRHLDKLAVCGVDGVGPGQSGLSVFVTDPGHSEGLIPTEWEGYQVEVVRL